jgi:hypothetical protein
MKAQILTLTVALFLTGCGGGPPSPSSPTQLSSTSSQPPPTMPAALSGVTNWNVTQRFGSVSGPDNCWVRGQRERWSPAVFPDLPMKITQSDGSIKLEPSYHVMDYTGTYVGSEFSATGDVPLEGSLYVTPCPEGPVVQLAGTSALSGHFSADGRLLTATEVNTYPLASGETVTYKWEWQATRLN